MAQQQLSLAIDEIKIATSWPCVLTLTATLMEEQPMDSGQGDGGWVSHHLPHSPGVLEASAETF